MSVKDIKPKLGGVIDEKPTISVSDVRPTLALIDREQEVYITKKMAYQGEPMGLLLALTYPVDTYIGTTTRT